MHHTSSSKKPTKLCGDNRLTPQEQLMLTLGVERYRRTVISSLASGSSSTSLLAPSSSLAVSRILVPFRQALVDWLDTYFKKGLTGVNAMYGVYLAEAVELLGIDTVITLAASIAAEHAFDAVPIRKASTSIGIELEFQAKAKRFKEAKASVFNAVLDEISHRRHPFMSVQRRRLLTEAKKNGIYVAQIWDAKTRMAIGTILSHLFVRASGGIFVTENITTRASTVFTNKTRAASAYRLVTIIKTSDEFLSWRDKFEELNQACNPVYLPSTEVLKPWQDNDLTSGGYPTFRYTAFKGMSGDHKCMLPVERLDAADYSTVFASMNRCQNVRYRINRPVLEIIRQLHKADNGIIYPRSPDTIAMPEYPADMESLSEQDKNHIKIGRALAFEEQRELADKRRKFVRGLLSIQKTELEKADGFYIPVQLDYRGRMYPYSTHALSYQGDDTSRALLEFADEASCIIHDKPHSIRALKIQGANLAGLNKRPFNERIQWVDLNQDLIFKTADDPLGTGLWWTNIDDHPLQLLSWILDYTAAVRDHKPSRFTCVLDASSNCYQIIALLTNDQELAYLSNITDTATDDDCHRNDIYEYVAKQIENILVHRIHTDPLFVHALGFGITRSFVKSAVLSIPYGISIKGIQNRYLTQINEIYRLRKLRPVGADVDSSQWLSFQKRTILSGRLAAITMEVIHKLFPSLKQLLKLMRTVVYYRIKTLKKPAVWTTPCGIPFTLNHPEEIQTNVSAVLFNTGTLSTRRLAPSVWETKPDSLSLSHNRRAATPNFIQAIDASVLHLAFASCPTDIPVFGVHDCVGSNAEHIDFVADRYRNAFIKTFRDKDYLKEFAEANEFDMSRLPSIIPPFDADLHNKLVDSVSASRYFLS